MRYILVGVTFLLLGTSVNAQIEKSTFSGQFDQILLKEALTRIEDQSDYRFYYKTQWLDSIIVSGQFENTPVSTVLDKLLGSTSLSFYVFGNQIILTNNTVIVDTPPITKAYAQAQEVDEIAKGLVFSREYLQNGLDQDPEKKVYEVGNRNEMIPGEISTIAGYVRDNENNEPIEGALVYVQDPFIAASTDSEGFYTLNLPNGKHTLLVQFVGMKTTKRNIVLFSSGKLNIDMEVDIIALQEVTVESDRDVNLKNVQMGVSKINVESVKTVPIVLGERDVMKIATTTAGVQTLGEGASGFNVRGGKTDQNLILINDAPIYNTSHFFGFFSIFNSDAIQGMELSKSGIPAQYGGRLSSVFSIESKSPDRENLKGEGGISPVTSRLTLEIPIVKKRTALLLGGRSTYSNWILKRIPNTGFNDNRVSFYDLIARIDHTINDKNELTLSGYLSQDKFRLTSDTLFSFSDFSYTNANASAKWKHRFNDRFDAVVTGVHSHYRYQLSFDQSPPNAFEQSFGIDETTLMADLNYYIEEIHKLKLGLSTKRYQINPGSKKGVGQESIVADFVVPEEQGLESAIYLSEEYNVSPALTFYGGLRYSMFHALGPADVFNYEEGVAKNAESQLGSTHYRRGEVIETYHGPEFRLSGRFSLDDQTSIKVGYNRMRQYIHSLSNSASLSPTDTWRISGTHLPPQISDQVAVGLYRNFFRNKVETSIEGYYKKLQNLVDFKVGAEFLLNQFIEQAILQGDGKSYGIEVTIKKQGKFNGWLNYTYARTFIRLDGNTGEERVNNGKFFPTNYDKPHTVNLVANYKLTRRLSFSLNTNYFTGRPVTVPVAGYQFRGSENVHHSDRNSYRIPDYFRIDLGINLEGNHKIEKLSHSFWSFSIYNLTGRDNPYSVFFDLKDGEIRAYQLIIFGNPIPTLSYNFKF